MMILHTDLWTRAIHLLQIEPSRSAETPNSFRDLNDMLTNHTSARFLLKSNSTPQYECFLSPPLSWRLSIHANDEQKPLHHHHQKKKNGVSAPPPTSSDSSKKRKQHCRALNLQESLVGRQRFCGASPPQALWRWYRE